MLRITLRALLTAFTIAVLLGRCKQDRDMHGAVAGG
jgi:hypothetical protein